jgi:hypothetical protein
MAGFVAGAMVVGSVITGSMGAKAQRDAANTQAAAAGRAQDQLLAAGEEASQGYTPYTEAGKTALSSITGQLPYFQQQFTNQDLNSYLDPGYQFRLGQGQRANMMGSNVTGGAVSGNALKSLQDYSQNFASGEFTNAFNRFQTQRTNIYNQLSDIAKTGLTAQQGTANALLGTGTNIASITSGLGNAQAASQIGQANAIGGAVQGVTNAASYYGLNNMNNPAAMQAQLSYGGYGPNAYSNYATNPSVNPASSEFIGPRVA